MASTKEKLIELELALHSYEVRSSRERLDELIDDEFREIGASGAYFGKQEVLDRLPSEDAIRIEASEFEFREFSETVCHLTYKSKLYNSIDALFRVSYRTSIWKYAENKWKMIFHQGTFTE